MSGKASDIEQALTAAFLEAFPDADTLCAWPNKEFSPNGLAKWYQFFYMPGTPEVATLGGSQGQDRVEGVVQVNLFIKPNSGDKVARDFADTLRSAFTAGRGILFSQGVVTIRNAGQKGLGYQVDQHYRTPFVIAWEARIQR